MEYSRKVFGQKIIDNLGPKNYKLMPVNIKRDVFYTERNRITVIEMKKKIQIWLFSILK